MKKLLVILIFILSISLFADRDKYNTDEVKLGTAVGLAHADYKKIDQSNQIIWGFYVDIPIINTLNITPSAMVYKLDYDSKNLSATDISLNFKFKVPLRVITLYFETISGLTQAQFSDDSGVAPHVGFGGGVDFNLVSNISFFGEANYRVIIRDEGNIKNYVVLAGLLWSF